MITGLYQHIGGESSEGGDDIIYVVLEVKRLQVEI